MYTNARPPLSGCLVVGKIPGYLISKVGQVKSTAIHHLTSHLVSSRMTKSIATLRALRRTTASSFLERPLVRPAISTATTAAARQSRIYSTHPSKPPKQGQPLHSSHPHLVISKHLTTGIPASEYEDRRKKLMESLGEGAIVICMGNTVRLVTQRMSPSTP